MREHAFGQELASDVRGPKLLEQRTSQPCFSSIALSRTLQVKVRSSIPSYAPTHHSTTEPGLPIPVARCASARIEAEAFVSIL